MQLHSVWSAPCLSRSAVPCLCAAIPRDDDDDEEEEDGELSPLPFQLPKSAGTTRGGVTVR